MSLCRSFSLLLFCAPLLSAAGLTNIYPPSGLLPPGTTSINLQFNTAQADTCRFSVGNAAALSFNSMSTMDTVATTAHVATVSGLSANPQTLNTVQVACASAPTSITTLAYRAVTVPNGNYPRIGSIWIGDYIYSNNLLNAEKIQLYLGAGLSPSQATTLRNANANVIILPSTNTVEVSGYPNGVVYPSITLPNGSVTAPITVPDSSYYLRDVNGNPISDWPGDYLLNLTNPAVAQFLAQSAYQVLSSTNFAYDGIFFDNFYTSISWFTTDVNGNPVQISSANNGVADNPATLDAAWSAGVYAELAAFRNLTPGAYTAGHLGSHTPAGGSLDIYNGNSLVFAAVDVREGTMTFNDFWNLDQGWMTQSQTPALTMVQSSPPNQIAYGYGFTPIAYSGPSVIPSATAAFGQTFYPNMRFGLASSLMNDGFFTYDFGDTGAPVNWWYDEYDFNLGTPSGAATNISGVAPGPQLVSNGSFESGLTGWNLSVDNSGGDTAAATLSLDSTTAAQGTDSAHVSVTSPTTTNWHIGLVQYNVSLTAGVTYELTFSAKASAIRTIEAELQAGAPGYANYYSNDVSIGTTWHSYTLSFTAGTTDPATSLEFFLGGPDGDIWLDNVQLNAAQPGIFRRDFSNGTVLLNGTNSVQTINVGSGYQRFTGSQAPLYQYIVDDTDSGFSATGSWTTETIDTGYGTTGSGEIVNGPYYHAWNRTAQTNTGSGTAQWSLHIPADGTYTIQAWLPASPAASTWSKNATYRVMAGSTVLATGTIDQTSAASGDEWHTIATNVALTASSAPVVVLSSGDGRPLLADALYITSAARYNDGSTATTVTLQPFDGILLQKQTNSNTPQTITFNAIPNQLVGTSMSLSATATSGLPVSFSSSTTSVCTVSGSSASFIAAGLCSITASQAGNSTYAAATPVSQSFGVVLNAQTISFGAIAQQNPGSTLTLTATASSGLPVSYSSSTTGVCTVSGNTASLLAIGTCTITASQPGNSIFAAATSVSQSFGVGLNSQTISFPAIGQQSVGSTLALTATASSGLPVGFSSSTTGVCTVSGTTASFLASGTCSLTASQPGNSTYAAATPVSQSITITGVGSSVGGLQFVPVTPCRVADTRTANGAFGGPELSGGTARDFLIPYGACNIPSNAAAYSLNVTAVPSGGLSFLAVWPSGLAQPLVSTLNSDSRVKANAAIVPAGANGGVAVYVSDPSNVILDINGYFVAGSTTALDFYPVTPCRISDTRTANGTLGGPYLSAGIPRSIPILSSSCGIPSNAQAYSLNFTAIPHSSLSYLTTWPTGQTQPLVSTLNSNGAVVANAAIVSAGTAGSINTYASDDTDLVIDVNGYFAPAATGGLSLYNVTPCRVIDTRTSSGVFDGTLNVTISPSNCVSAPNAQAFVLNATVVPPSDLSFLSLWPNGQVQPLVSTLNADDGVITSNMAIVPSTNGIVSAYGSNPTQLILDIAGYFAP